MLKSWGGSSSVLEGKLPLRPPWINPHDTPFLSTVWHLKQHFQCNPMSLAGAKWPNLGHFFILDTAYFLPRVACILGRLVQIGV
jgi:hypothetical protein